MYYTVEGKGQTVLLFKGLRESFVCNRDTNDMSDVLALGVFGEEK